MSSTRNDPEGDLMGVVPRPIPHTAYLTAEEREAEQLNQPPLGSLGETPPLEGRRPSPEYVSEQLARMRAVLAQIKQR